MKSDQLTRRDLLSILTAAATTWVTPPREAQAQTGGPVPVRVDTKGLVAKIKFESVLSGYLTDLNGKYKLRVTELTLEPGGHVGEHNHVGPGIRMMTFGEMTCCPTRRSSMVPGTSSSSRVTSTTPSTTRATSRTSTCCSRSSRRT